MMRIPKDTQHMEQIAMSRMAMMTNREFYGFSTLVTCINAAMKDDMTSTVYASRIDGCLWPAEVQP